MHLCGHSVNLFLAQSGSIQHIPANGASVLGEKGKSFPVDECKEGLVGYSPNTVPRSIEWIRHSRAQHVVEVDLSHLEEKEKEAGKEMGGLQTECLSPYVVHVS